MELPVPPVTEVSRPRQPLASPWRWMSTSRGGLLYVSDHGTHTVRKIDLSSGMITRFAGTNTVAGDDGDTAAATSAHFRGPDGVAVSGSDVYISDGYNTAHRIRKVNSDGIINTVVGTGTNGTAGNTGLATSATIENAYSYESWND